MTDQLPSPQLLDEYGLNEVSYTALLVIADMGELHFLDLARRRIPTGRPAPTLRSLVDRGLLAGPARQEHINKKTFTLTEKGRNILARIERGLHQPEWITPARALALQTLVKNGGALIYSPAIYGRKFSRATLDSLAKHGYLDKVSESYRLTFLGREAWAEYLTSVPLGKGVGESEFPPLAGERGGAHG